MPRPLINEKIEGLESLFAEASSRGATKTIAKIKSELRHRGTKRAAKLAARVKDWLAERQSSRPAAVLGDATSGAAEIPPPRERPALTVEAGDGFSSRVPVQVWVPPSRLKVPRIASKRFRVPPGKLRASLLAALEQEIAAVQAGKSAAIINLHDGRFSRVENAQQVLVFRREPGVYIQEDAPGYLVYASGRYRCTVLSVADQSVEVGVYSEEDLEAAGGSAQLQTDLSYLLIALRDRVLSFGEGGYPARFAVSERMFTNNLFNSAGSSTHSTPACFDSDLNYEQRNAARKAMRDQFSVIWGPPGTGKTKVLAEVVVSLLAQGRRVFVAAHANAAVDVLMKRVLESPQAHVRELYQSGRLLRFGSPCENDLASYRGRFPLALPEEVARRANPALVESLNRLRSERQVLVRKVHNLEVRAGKAEQLERASALLRLDALRAEIKYAEAEFRRLSDEILEGAILVSTTLTKLSCNDLIARQFCDVLIVDEVSMAPLPQVFWATSLPRQKLIFGGDFMQLPPIGTSCAPDAAMWFGANLFDVLKVGDRRSAEADERVVALKEQYRMVPPISSLVSSLFYGGMLRNGPGTDRPCAGEPVELMDTSGFHFECIRPPGGSRINLGSAAVVALLVKRLSAGLSSVVSAEEKIGVVTPYRAQANLLRKVLSKDMGFEGVLVDTVHRFQGGEVNALLFDLVEGGSQRVAPMLNDDPSKDGTSARLFNVALSRAKNRVMIIADFAMMSRSLGEPSTLRAVFDRVASGPHGAPGVELPGYDSLEPISFIRASSAEELATQVARFDPRCKKVVLIVRSCLPEFIEPFLGELRARGQTEKVLLITSPSVQVSEHERDGHDACIRDLQSCGVATILMSKVPCNVCVEVGAGFWFFPEWSKDRDYRGMRYKGCAGSQEFLNALGFSSLPVLPESGCPRCQRPIVLRRGKYRYFWGCTGFKMRNCDFVAKVTWGAPG